MEQLRQLHGVRRGALAQVVGDDPEVERALVAGVAANPADQDLVAAGGLDRHRETRRAGLVDDLDAGRRGEQLARPLGLERLARLDVYRLRVAGDDGDADAGG